MKYKLYLQGGMFIICNGIFSKLTDSSSSITKIMTEGHLYFPEGGDPIHSGQITFNESAFICGLFIK